MLYEILALEGLGVPVALFPLLRERETTMHAEAEDVVRRARYTPLLLSWRLLAAHLYFLARRPQRYFGALLRLLWANLGSRRYFVGAVTYFPKAVLLAREIQREGIRHLHAHFASHPAAVAYVVHRLSGVPFSFTAHGSDLHRDQHMLREKVEAAKLVVAISEYNRDLILRHCGAQFADKVQVVHCGVDLSRFHPDREDTVFARGEGPFQIVCTGTLHEVKGQRYLIEACRRLAAEGESFECHFLGDGPDRQKLEDLAAAVGLQGRVHFHGSVPQHELRERLAAADLLVAPSVPTQCGRREGIPVALMEAMSCGLPVVASRLSGIPELVEHEREGLLVEPRDVDGLGEALLRMLRDAAFRESLAAPARAKVEREFDLRANAMTLARYFRPEVPS